MARRRKGQRPTHVAPAPQRKRSLQVPLYLLGAAAVIGYPILRDATAEDMQRNRYGADRQSCECDYGPRCTVEDGQWFGPWYAANATERKADDPGWGACYTQATSQNAASTSGHAYYRYGSFGGGPDGYRRPLVERGFRGGFGATGRIRSASS